MRRVKIAIGAGIKMNEFDTLDKLFSETKTLTQEENAAVIAASEAREAGMADSDESAEWISHLATLAGKANLLRAEKE